MNKLNKLVGFIVMTFMYAEVFAENRKAKTVHHKVAEQLSGDSKLYGMQLNIGGFYGSKSKGASKNASYGLVDVLLPLYQTQDSLYFLDVRGLRYNANPYEFNVGLGGRWLLDDARHMLGLYTFYDYKNSEANKKFHQMTFGAEYKTGGWSLGANYYLPIATTKHHLGSTNFAEHVEATGNIIYGFNRTYEKALQGVDGEVGYTFGNTGLTAYVGGYYFDAAGVDAVAGPRGTLNLNLIDTFAVESEHLDAFALEASVQHDNPRGTTYYAGARLSFGFGGAPKNKLNRMQKSMTDFVRRDLDVVVGESQALKEITNHLYSDVPGLESTKMEVVAVDELSNNIDRGSHVITLLNKDQVINSEITMRSGILTGGKYTFVRDGETFTVVFGDQVTLSTVSNLSRMIELVGHASDPALGKMEIHGLTLKRGNDTMTYDEEAGTHYYFSIANDSGRYYSIVLQDNNIIGGQINLKGEEGSTFSIKDNTITVTGIDAARGALYLGEGEHNKFDVRGNTIISTVTQQVDEEADLAVVNINSLAGAEFVNNTIISTKNVALNSHPNIISMESSGSGVYKIHDNNITDTIGNYQHATNLLAGVATQVTNDLEQAGHVQFDGNTVVASAQGISKYALTGLFGRSNANSPTPNTIKNNTIELSLPGYDLTNKSDLLIVLNSLFNQADTNIATTITGNTIVNSD